MPSLDGSDIFGLAVKVRHVPNPSAQQVNSFFGISGTQLIYGGQRGRGFFVEGVLIASDVPSLGAAEKALLDCDDGIARTFVDTWGRSWANVIFKGEYQPDQAGPRPLAGGAGWALPYRAVLHGLT